MNKIVEVIDYELSDFCHSEELSEDDEEEKEVHKVEYTSIKDSIRKMVKMESNEEFIPGFEDSGELDLVITIPYS